MSFPALSTQQHCPDTIERCAQQAIDRIRALNMPLLPALFAVWYVYYQGNDCDLIRQVDEIMQNSEVKPEYFLSLFDQIMDRNTDSHNIEGLLEILEKAVNSMSGTMEEQKGLENVLEQELQSISTMNCDSNVQNALTRITNGVKNLLQNNQSFTDEIQKMQKQTEILYENVKNAQTEARTDGLTKLYNRRYFDEAIENIMQSSVERSSPLCLLLLDIDHFKKVNDNYGHLVGDFVLQYVAHVLRNSLKGKDIVCRYGGEEFAILLPDTSVQGGRIVANQLRQAIASKELNNKSTGEVIGFVTISIGVAQYVPNMTSNALITAADQVLYKAKMNGRNRVICAPVGNPI